MEVLPFSAHLTMTDADPAVAAAAAVQAVALKLPTFLAARPDVWFQQTEAQFALRNITDPTTKYYYLLTALDPVVAERMAGDVAVTPGDGKYDYLKAKLLEVYGLTDDQKADRLLDLTGLGDWKPSQLCAHIQGLAVDRDVLLRRIFLRQLPEDVRIQVAALDTRNLSELARKADIIMAAKQALPTINASTLSKKKSSRAPVKANLCWYHAKFGHKAKACRPPCGYSATSGEHHLAQGNDQASP